MPKEPETVCWETIGHSIYDIIGCGYFLETDFSWNDTVPNEVISNVNMLGGVVVNRIFRQSNNTPIVVVDKGSRIQVDLSKRVCQSTEP